MTEPRRPMGYVDQSIDTTPAMRAHGAPQVRPRAPSLPRVEEAEPSLAEVMGAIRVISDGLYRLTEKVDVESLKSAGDRSLTNAAIHVLQQDMAAAKSGPLRLPTIPPPSSMVPPRDPSTSTGQHAIVLAQAALQGVDAIAQQQAAASVDYARDQERAKAEIYEHFAAIAKEARAGFAKWAAVGSVVFAILSTLGGYATIRAANKDVARETAVEVARTSPVQPAPVPSAGATP